MFFKCKNFYNRKISSKHVSMFSETKFYFYLSMYFPILKKNKNNLNEIKK